MNLNRLNFHNQKVVLKYLFLKAIGFEIDLNTVRVYLYYNYLIKLNGTFKGETKSSFISRFKTIDDKNVCLRKLPSSDMAVLDQVILMKEYQSVVSLYESKFTESSIVNIIDAGSNIGLTTMFFKTRFPSSNIYCFEPDFENFKVLEFNLNNNNYNNIFKFNAAIWNENTKVEIVKDFRDKLDWSSRVKLSNRINTIDAYTLNYIMSVNNLESIDILKMDIEGAEKEIFTSTISDLNFLNLTKVIAIEIHNEFNCYNDIIQILIDHGFVVNESGELTIGYNKNLI